MTKTRKTSREVIGWHDARCPKCGYKISWFGRLSRMPDCKRCQQKEAGLAAIKLRNDVSLLDAFTLTKLLYHDRFDRMVPTEASFIANMRRRGRRGQGYSEIQTVSIRRLAIKYSVRFDNVDTDNDGHDKEAKDKASQGSQTSALALL